MGLDIHTIEVPDAAGANLSRTDRVFLGVLNVAYGAGGGAGQAVVVTAPLAGLPSTVYFFPEALADATAFVSTAYNGAQVGITFEPRNPANTLAAGSMNFLLFA